MAPFEHTSPPMASSQPTFAALAAEPHGMLAIGFASVIMIWYCILWAIFLLGLHVARTRYGSPAVVPAPSSAKPGVSILRPLKGLDPNLYENLRSAFEQDYPDIEIIFSVADDKDPALRVVNELIDRFGADTTNDGRRRTVRVVTGDVPLGPNPKINNLIKPFSLATHDILHVLDSGIHLPSQHTLSRAVEALLEDAPGRNRVGLVHHVPFAVLPGKGGTGVGSWLERAFLNSVHAKMYLAINKTEIDSCVMGKSNIYRRSDVSVVTAGHAKPTPTSPLSLPSFAPFLAEDNLLALSLMHQLSLRHSLPATDVALNNLGSMSFADYFWRRVRWIRVRKAMTLAATCAEPFTEGVVMGALSCWAVGVLVGGVGGKGVGWTRGAWLVLHWAAWAACDWAVMSSLTPQPNPSTPLSSPDLESAPPTWSGAPPASLRDPSDLAKFWLAWIGRELLALPVWLTAMLGNEVVWRGRRYVMLRDGRAREVDGTDVPGQGWLAGVRSGGTTGAGERRGYESVSTEES